MGGGGGSGAHIEQHPIELGVKVLMGVFYGPLSTQRCWHHFFYNSEMYLCDGRVA